MEWVERRSRDHTTGDTTHVGRRRDSSHVRDVVKTQTQACTHQGAFRPGYLTKHRCQPAQRLDQFANLRERHGAGSFGSFEAGLQLVAFRGAATQCGGQILNATPDSTALTKAATF